MSDHGDYDLAHDFLKVTEATAMRCTNGEILGRLKLVRDSDRERMAEFGIHDPDQVYRTDELVPGESIVFPATGVTGGDLIRGVSFFRKGARTHSLVMSTKARLVRFLHTIQVAEGEGVTIPY